MANLGRLFRGLMDAASEAAPAADNVANNLRISTRLPTAAKAVENPLTNMLSIGAHEAIQGDTGAFNANLLPTYPGYARLAGLSPEEIAQGYIDQSTDNLRFLIENLPTGVLDETAQWYEGANRISNALANQYDMPVQSTSAALAALSPQKDWYQNASLGERLIDIYSRMNDGSRNMSSEVSPEMLSFMRNASAYKDPMVDPMIGKPFGEMTPVEQAMFIRAYDEVNNPRVYRQVTPEGMYGDIVTSASGAPSRVAWGSFNEIAKAIQALQSGGDMNVISPLLGERHKVRNFYNNIVDPTEQFGRYGDVTADTHAVAANQLRPLSGNTVAVAHNFKNALANQYRPDDWVGAKGSSLTGVQGTYGFNVDPYRNIAEEYGIAPRAAQSVAWEAGRALFPAEFKTAANANMIDNIWRAYDAGEIDVNQARQAVFEAAGGFGEGNWGQPRSGLLAPETGSTYR